MLNIIGVGLTEDPFAETDGVLLVLSKNLVLPCVAQFFNRLRR